MFVPVTHTYSDMLVSYRPTVIYRMSHAFNCTVSSPKSKQVAANTQSYTTAYQGAFMFKDTCHTLQAFVFTPVCAQSTAQLLGVIPMWVILAMYNFSPVSPLNSQVALSKYSCSSCPHMNTQNAPQPCHLFLSHNQTHNSPASGS